MDLMSLSTKSPPKNLLDASQSMCEKGLPTNHLRTVFVQTKEKRKKEKD